MKAIVIFFIIFDNLTLYVKSWNFSSPALLYTKNPVRSLAGPKLSLRLTIVKLFAIFGSFSIMASLLTDTFIVSNKRVEPATSEVNGYDIAFPVVFSLTS